MDRAEAHKPPSPQSLIPVACLLVLGLCAAWLVPAGLATAKGSPHQMLRAAATGKSVPPQSLDKAYQDAVSIRPGYGPTHLAAALAFAADGREERARASLRLAHEFDHWNPAPLLVNARKLKRQGQSRDALRLYAEALHLATFTRGPGRDGIIREIGGQFDQPADLIAALPPNHPESWETLLKLLREKRRFALTLKVAEGLADQAKPGYARQVALTWVAQSAADTGDWRRARTQSLSLVEKSGPSTAYTVLVRAHLHTEEISAALSTAEIGLKQHPEEVELLFLTAEILLSHQDALDLGNDPAAWGARVEPVLDALRPFAIRRQPLRYRYYTLSGQYHEARGQLPSAIADFRKAFQAKPSEPDTLVQLARLFEEDRQMEGAREVYQQMLDRFPSHPLAPEFAVRLVELNRRLETLENFRSQGKPRRP